MNLWVDDLRSAPDGWLLATTASEAIALLRQGNIQHLSLDHDLGEPASIVGSGYQVAIWLEEQAHTENWAVIPDRISIHSANPVGRQNMRAAIDAIDRLRRRLPSVR